jgi:hypothetical protein
LAGIAAVDDGLAADAGLVAGVALGLLFADGDADFVGEADDFGFGVGETVFSVVTETLGSLRFSDAVASGEGLSSWAYANGTTAANRVARARTAIFIWFSFGGTPDRDPVISFEGRIVGGSRKKGQGSNSPQNLLAMIVLQDLTDSVTLSRQIS